MVKRNAEPEPDTFDGGLIEGVMWASVWMAVAISALVIVGAAIGLGYRTFAWAAGL